MTTTGTLAMPGRRPAPVVERSGERRPFKAPKWSHQRVLEAAVGRTIHVASLDGTAITGTLVGVDAYTLCVARGSAASPEVDVIFKHALASFRVAK